MFGNKKVKLSDTLAKVDSFTKELEDGIAQNDEEVDGLCKQLEEIEAEIKAIEAQTEQARKLLSKIK